MITIEKLLQQITNPLIRSQVLKNLWHERAGDKPRIQTPSEAIKQAFKWYHAPQGIMYWNSVYCDQLFIDNILLW